MSDHSLLAQPQRRGFTRVLQGSTGLAALATLTALIALQDVAARLQWINDSKFPSATRVLQETGRLLVEGELTSPLLSTLGNWLASLFIALALGFVLGIAIGSQRWLSALLIPIVEFIRPVPSTALIPLVILAIGASASGAIFLTVFGTLWQVLPLFIDGTRQLDPMAKEVAAAFRLPRRDFFLFVRLPTLWAAFRSALRIGGAAALVLLISMEYLAGIDGIGKEVSIAYSGSNYLRMYACVVVTLLLSVALNLLLGRQRGGVQ